jgi:penicillin-insensitive murein endopeptidase
LRAHSVTGAALLCLSTGCFGSTTPLSPGLRGSVGLPHLGVQTHAVELPVRGEGFERYRQRDPNHWAQPRLVAALTRIAAKLQAEDPTAPPLVFGDLSAPHGGKIPRHMSHRTGRDVDLLWYVTTPSGAPVRNPGFVRVGSDGLAPLYDTGAYLRLDVERQWRLIKELMVSDEIGVQFLFVSTDVEALLIDYAIAKGEDPILVWRAATVMLQPGDSAPHDDHLHLRIACSPEEMIQGCEGGGPYWPWLPQPGQLDLTLAELERAAAEDPLGPEPLAEAAAQASAMLP